jgi:MFS family permease
MSSASPARSARRQRIDFWTYWSGQTISNLGSSFTLFALPLLVYKLTGSALNLGITTAATFVPYLLFGLVIGAWVDRVDRKRLMILTDVLRAAAIASIPAMATIGRLTAEWIYGVAFVSATLGIFFTASEFAVIPSLVEKERLVTANGRMQASFAGASVLGPALAGLLLTLLPLHDVFLVDAASFLVSSLSLVLVRGSFNQEEGPRKQQHILRDVGEGLRYVLRHPVLRNISAMMALYNLVNNMAFPQLVLFAKRQLIATDAQVAWLYAAGSVGMVVFSLLAGPLRKRWSFGVVALGGLMLGGLGMLALSFQHQFWVAMPIWAFCGIGVLLDINTFSLRQAIVPNEMLGRVISIAGVLAWSAIPVGSLVGGALVQRTGNVALVFGLVGTLTFLIPLCFFLFSPLGHAERYVPAARAGGSQEPVAAEAERTA